MIWKLLKALEHIEEAFPTDKEKYKKGKTNPGNSNKRKMVSFLELIPKKKHPVTSTVFCARNMGVHTALTT